MTNPIQGTSLPMERRHIETSDLDVTRAGLTGLWGDTRLEVSESFVWRVDAVQLGPLLITQGACSTTADLRLEALAGHTLMLRTASAVRATAMSRRAEIASSTQAIIGSAGVPHEIRLSAPISTFNARLDPGFLRAHLEGLTGESVRDPLLFDLQLAPRAAVYIERLCRFLFEEAMSGEALTHPAVQTGLLDSLAGALLTFADHSHSELLAGPAPPSSRTVVRRVEEYMDEHASAPISSSDLVKIAGVPVRSLESAFRLHRGKTPTAHLQSRRLQSARQQLQSDPTMPVSSVAHACGFGTFSSFAAAYYKAFGERPEETRRRAAPDSEPPTVRPLHTVDRADRLTLLSPREHDVCVRIVRGMLNKQVAADLGLSERTVKEYRAHAMAKLGVTSLAELVRVYQETDHLG